MLNWETIKSGFVIGQTPQSVEQIKHVSSPLHKASPQYGGQVPQSSLHEVQSSSRLQIPSPQ